MFLANSLNDKLKRSLSEFDLIHEKECPHPYHRPPQNPKCLVIQKEHPEYTSSELAQMSKKDFERKFTIPKLKQKWKEKFPVNFDLKHKKFIADCMSQRAKTAKEYVKDLLAPDLFETRQQRWNKCTKFDEKNFRPPLKKTLFEVTHGLNNFQVVPLKEHKVEEGVDVKYKVVTPDTFWNNSTKMEVDEMKDIEKNNLISAMNNTQKYWNKTEINRLREDEFPITEERKKVEEPRYFKPYRDPKSLTTYHYKVMNHVKDITWIEREKITNQIKHDNPGCEKYKEKIDSLVRKKMLKTYEDKFDVLVGKKKEKKNEVKVYDWKDDELINKIETITNWKDISWFQPKISRNSPSNVNEKDKRKELLKPLVKKGLDILKEEDRIKEKKLNEYKKKLKMDMMKKKNTSLGQEKVDPLKVSKYPLDKISYELQGKVDDKENEAKTAESLINFTYNNNNVLEGLQTMDGNSKFFLDAYKKVILNEEEKLKKLRSLSCRRRNDQWIEYKFYHPGTYREFEFGKADNGDSNKGYEKSRAWSCCMNTSKNSKGCHRQKINKHKWNLDHF